MITVTYNGEPYECDRAVKGTDYIHLLNSDGTEVATFDGCSSFSGFTISGGTYEDATDHSNCKVAAVDCEGKTFRTDKCIDDLATSNNPIFTGSVSQNRKAGTTVGDYSHAEGQNTTAIGNGSHAEGKDTIAKGTYQHVEGKYNVQDSNETYAHIVGGGTDADHRKNIYTLDWDGNAEFDGDVTDGDGNTLSQLNTDLAKRTNNVSRSLGEIDASKLDTIVSNYFSDVTDGRVSYDCMYVISGTGSCMVKGYEYVDANYGFQARYMFNGDVYKRYKNNSGWSDWINDIANLNTDLTNVENAVAVNLADNTDYNFYVSGGKIAQMSSIRTKVEKLTQGETYTIVADANDRFLLALTADFPTVGMAANKLVESESLHEYTFTVASGYNYMILYYASNINTQPVNVMIEVGSVKHSHQPYIGADSIPKAIANTNDVVGGNTINVLPNYATTKTQNGITMTVNADKSLTFIGTGSGTGTTWFDISGTNPLSYHGIYTLSGCPSGGGESTYKLEIGYLNGASITDTRDFGNGKTFSLDGDNYCSSIGISNGQAVNAVFKPQLEVGRVKHNYVPYIGGSLVNAVSELNENLCNVDNTSDLDKPISTATQTALNALSNIGQEVIALTNGTLTLSWVNGVVIADVDCIIGGALVAGNQYVIGTNIPNCPDVACVASYKGVNLAQGGAGTGMITYNASGNVLSFYPNEPNSLSGPKILRAQFMFISANY